MNLLFHTPDVVATLVPNHLLIFQQITCSGTISKENNGFDVGFSVVLFLQDLTVCTSYGTLFMLEDSRSFIAFFQRLTSELFVGMPLMF
jgi:hypothetical protein